MRVVIYFCSMAIQERKINRLMRPLPGALSSYPWFALWLHSIDAALLLSRNYHDFCSTAD